MWWWGGVEVVEEWWGGFGGVLEVFGERVVSRGVREVGVC